MIYELKFTEWFLLPRELRMVIYSADTWKVWTALDKDMGGHRLRLVTLSSYRIKSGT
jgi:hypothetical protein